MTVGVGEHVHVESWDADILLMTNVATLHILPAHLQVGLLVSGEVGAGGKTLATLIALVF